jgi:hypothetical protein
LSQEITLSGLNIQKGELRVKAIFVEDIPLTLNILSPILLSRFSKTSLAKRIFMQIGLFGESFVLKIETIAFKEIAPRERSGVFIRLLGARCPEPWQAQPFRLAPWQRTYFLSRDSKKTSRNSEKSPYLLFTPDESGHP